MLLGAAHGLIEVRAEDDGGARLTGRFPYGAEAELAPGRAEVFAAGSLEPRADVHLLSQHRFEAPLASTRSGTLDLRSDGEALTFEARIAPEIAQTTHGRDALAMIRSGLAAGLSPGFRVQPDGERIERRGGGILRTIRRAELHELSIVTRPAFDAASVEARSWQAPSRRATTLHPSWGWR